MTRHLFVVAVIMAAVLRGQELPAEDVDYSLIPVDMVEIKVPEVDVPKVEIGKANAVYMVLGALGSYPMSFYVSAKSVAEKELAEGALQGEQGVLMTEIREDTVFVPSVSYGDAASADVHIGKIASGKITLTNVGIANVELATVKVPQLRMADIRLANVAGVTVDGSENLVVAVSDGRITLVDVDTGKARSVNVAVGSAADGKLRLVDVETGKVYVSDVKASTVEVRNVAVPSVYSAEDRMRGWAEFMRRIKGMFKDRRMAMHDKGMSPFNEALPEWLEIYRTCGDYEMEHVPLPGNIRMIAEVRAPQNHEQWATLRANLAFYSSLGYDSVLLAIRGSEDRNELLAVVRAIKSCGMKVWFALSGKETLTDTLFIRPSKIKECFAVVAPAAEGMLLGWRRTSVHLFVMDLEYANFLVKTARAHNPRLAVLGEGYYGQTGNSNERTNYLTYNMPRNVSGCEVIGVGYSNVNPKMALNSLYGAVRDFDRVAVVLGDRPYYATRNPNGMGFLENLAVKQRIERRFMEAGCIGTITIHGDGSDGMYGETASDNLAAPPCR